MANDLTINQISTIVNAVMAQATGKTLTTQVTDTSSFVQVGQAALKMGYDPLIQAISQVLGRTIFSVRPYSRKFDGIEVSNQKYGNMTRKLNICDKGVENDQRLPLTQDASVDMYKVDKPSILQTNFYGQETFQKHITIFRDQLDTAFHSPEEFGQFTSMVMQNTVDMLEQARENMARQVVLNFIGAKLLYNDGQFSAMPDDHVIHLISEYNALTGEELDNNGMQSLNSIFAPENYKPFMQWVYARIASASAMMTERSLRYHFNVTNFNGEDKSIMRHTPYEKQMVYLLNDTKFAIESRVLADTYHENYLRLSDVDTINFWQNIREPHMINVKPSMLTDTGEFSGITPISTSKVMGVIIDNDALGYTVVNQWNSPTPFNPAGGYTNLFWHETYKYWNDFTENGIVLCLD